MLGSYSISIPCHFNIHPSLPWILMSKYEPLSDAEFIPLTITKTNVTNYDSISLDPNAPTLSDEQTFSKTPGVSKHSNEGLWWMLLGYAMFTGMHLSVKALGKMANPLPSVEIQVFRGAIGTVISLASFYLTKTPDILGPPGTRMLVVFVISSWHVQSSAGCP
jgi:hypothetical protein